MPLDLGDKDDPFWQQAGEEFKEGWKTGYDPRVPTEKGQAKWEWLFKPHPQGSRHPAALVMAGYFRAKLTPLTPARVWMRGWNNAYCHPPLDDDELMAILDYGWRHWDEGGLEEIRPDGSRDLDIAGFSVAEMLAIAADPTQQVEWLMKEWIPAEGVTGLAGASGDGKTWLAMELARHLTEPFITNGRFLDAFDLPTRRVAYFEQDGNGKKVIAGRMAKLAFTAGNTNLRYYETSDLLLDRDADRKTLLRLCREHEADYTILDSLVAFHTKDENKSLDMRQVGKWLVETFVKNGIGVLFLHHDVKGAAGAASEKDKTRGSGDITAFTQSLLGLSKYKGVYTLRKRRVRETDDDEGECSYCIVPDRHREGVMLSASAAAEAKVAQEGERRDETKARKLARIRAAIEDVEREGGEATHRAVAKHSRLPIGEVAELRKGI